MSTRVTVGRRGIVGAIVGGVTLAGLLAAGASIAGGCQPSEQMRRLSEPAEATQGIVPITASELFELKKQNGTYKRVEGERSGKEYDYTITPNGQGWRLQIGDRHRLELIEQADGTISATQYVNLRNDVEIDYDPALPLLPGHLDGAVHEGQVEMTVRGLLGRRQMGGSVRYRVQAVDVREVQTHEGPSEGYIVEQHQELRLPLARAEIRMETAYVPGLGRVKDTIDREHRVLGLFGDDQTETYERVD